MESKDWGIILVLVLSICHGRGGLRGVAGDDRSTGFGKSNFFQDKFCDHFCPKDGSQPRLTLTDEQIETILNSEEVGCLYTRCLISFLDGIYFKDLIDHMFFFKLAIQFFF